MPIYEYICEQDGTVLELVRPMNQADAPVDDPEGRDRAFRRRHSTFATVAPRSAPVAPAAAGGCCPCGKPGGGCGAR